MKKEVLGILMVGSLVAYYLYFKKASLTPSPYGKYITDARGAVWEVGKLTPDEIERINQGWTQSDFGQPALVPPGAASY